MTATRRARRVTDHAQGQKSDITARLLARPDGATIQTIWREAGWVNKPSVNVLRWVAERAGRVLVSLPDGREGSRYALAPLENVVTTKGSPLKPDPKPAKLYEIHVNGGWLKVDWIEFRSWSGNRRKDGNFYKGPVFFWMTNIPFSRRGVK